MPVIELDMLIAFVNILDQLHKVADELFYRATSGEIRDLKIASSAYLEYEFILKSKGYKESEIRVDLAAFKEMPNIGEAQLTVNVVLKASEIREKYGLTYFDSLHGATAILSDGKIISSDKAFEKVKELKAINPSKL